MNKIKSWIRSKWDLWQLRQIWNSMDYDERINFVRDARYIVWRRKMGEKIAPSHRRVNPL